MNQSSRMCPKKQCHTNYALEAVVKDYMNNGGDDYDMQSDMLFIGEITVSPIFTDISNNNIVNSNIHAIIGAVVCGF